MSVKVSICIPAYNQVEFLKKTLESVRMQTFSDYEVIVSDDSENDLVKNLVNDYSANLKIKYTRNKPALGSPENWNNCLLLAEGKLIKFLHHDDWFKFPESLQKFVDACDQPNVNAAFCVSEILNVSANTVSYNRPPQQYIDEIKKDPKKLFCDNRIGAPTALIYKRNELKFDDKLKYVVDIDFYIRLLQLNNSLAFINEPLIVNTSNHSAQVTQASMNKETQIGEYVYLYKKMFGDVIPDEAIKNLFISLFRKYRIRKMSQVQLLSGLTLEPQWYFKWLMFRARL